MMMISVFVDPGYEAPDTWKFVRMIKSPEGDESSLVSHYFYFCSE